MARVSEGTKIFLSAGLIAISILSLIHILSSYHIHVFKGDQVEASTLLGTIIQCLSAIIAIVFTLVLFIGQFSLGKYVTRTVDYLLLNWLNFSMLAFYIATILVNIATLWNLSMGQWRLYVDVSVIMSILCVISLFPFFLSVPESLRPTRILDTIQKEIEGKHGKEMEFINRKIELMFSIVCKLRDAGEASDALYGVGLIGKIARSLELAENEYLFLNSIVSRLEEVSIESVEKQPSLVISCLNELHSILGFIAPKGFFFVANLGRQIAASSLAICKNSLTTRHTRGIAMRTYSLILRFYESSASVDGSIVMYDGLKAVREVADYANLAGLHSYELLGFELQMIITRLLKNNKEKESVSLFEILFELAPKDSHVLLFCIGLLFEIKVGEYIDLTNKIIQAVKGNFSPLEVEIKIDPNRSGRNISVPSYGHRIKLEVGSEDEERTRWIKDFLY